MDSAKLAWLHVVPWKNRQEFVQTYLDLYSEDFERQMNAAKRISMWRTRVGRKLSVAIENSESLTRALLTYKKAWEKKTHREYNWELRLQMGSAVMRFVNSVVEKGQTSTYAKPVHEIAKEVDLPQFLVNVRHDFAHRGVPSIAILERAVKKSLQYLQKTFWSVQITEEDLKFRKPKRPKPLYNLVEATALVEKYQKASYKSLSEGPDSEVAKEANRALRQIEHALDTQHRNVILHVLVQPGHLLPDKAQLKIYNIDVYETFRSWPHKVPDVLIKVWREVFWLVQKKELTDLLAQHLLYNMIQVNSDYHPDNFMMWAWLRLLLLYEAENFEKTKAERASQAELFPSSVMFYRSLLLATCKEKHLEGVCDIWVSTLLYLLNDGSVSEEELKEIDDSYTPYRKAYATEVDEKMLEELKDYKAVTLEDARKLRPDLVEKLEKDKKERKEATEKRMGKPVMEPFDWAMIPWGVLPKEAGYAGCVFDDPMVESSSGSNSEEESSEEITGQHEQEMVEEDDKPAAPEKSVPFQIWP